MLPITLTRFTILNFCLCERASHWGSFLARDWAWPPTWAGLKQGSGPWTAGSLFRQQLRHWGRSYVGGWSASFPNIHASHLKASLHPNTRVHPMEPLWSGAEQSKDVRFVLFATGSLKPESFPTSQCANKVHQSPCPAGLTSALQALAQPCEGPFQIHQCYFFLYWRYSHTFICLYCFSEAYQHSVANITFHPNITFHHKKCPFRWERRPGLAGIILDWRQEVFGWCFWWRRFVIQRSSPVSVRELTEPTHIILTWLLCLSFPLAKNQHSYIPG